MTQNNDNSGKKGLLENFMPINDPMLKNFRPESGPNVDPMAIPDVALGNPVGAKPSAGSAEKPATGSGSGTGSNTPTGTDGGPKSN
jgi:hypothetical protein